MWDKICLIKEGIVFAFHKKWDGEEHLPDEGIEGKFISAYENHAKEKLRKPEYRRVRISLERLVRSLILIEGSWQRTNRYHAQRELGNLLNRLHELETDVETIEDMFLREYIYEQLDMIASTRRSLAEEVRWDVEDGKKGIL